MSFVRQTRFPNCCTAEILFNFGETKTNGCDIGGSEVCEESLEKLLRERINWAGVTGNMLVAITNNQQKTMSKLFRKHGFRSSKWAAKQNHPETKIKLWYFIPYQG